MCSGSTEGKVIQCRPRWYIAALRGSGRSADFALIYQQRRNHRRVAGDGNRNNFELFFREFLDLDFFNPFFEDIPAEPNCFDWTLNNKASSPTEQFFDFGTIQSHIGPIVIMSAIRIVHPTPDIKRGVEYWEGVEASVDGVLGGFGHVSRVESLGSRSFLLSMLPHLSFCASASSNISSEQWKKDRITQRGGKGKARTRALDCGAGVGRVTQHSLLPIFDEVHMVEPVAKFLLEAKKQASSWPQIQTPPSRAPFQARKAVHYHCSTLQDIDPSRPHSTAQPVDGSSTIPSTVSIDDEPASESPIKGAESEADGVAGSKVEPVTYDLVWAQWCLQHLSDKDLIAFLKRSKAALKEGGIIGVKENVCKEEADGSERVWYDDEDHSITRSTKAYERVFKEAGLEIVKCEIQFGMPAELFVVKM